MHNKKVRLSARLALSLLAGTALAGGPSPVAVISGDEIQQSQVGDLEDIIRSLPNVARPPLPGSPDAGTRTATIDLRGLGSSRSLVLVNGRRVPTRGLGEGLGSDLDIGAIPPQLIDRVEVLRGPQGTLYGRNAAGGVVNIVTAPDFRPVEPSDSFVLGDLLRDIAPYRFALDSNEECDASHGTPMPFWTANPDVFYGRPWISPEGDFFAWGDRKDGFGEPSPYLPTPDTHYTPDLNYFARHDRSRYTYDAFNKLRARIRDYAGAPDADKRDYIFGLFFGSAFAGPGSLSDEAVAAGRFDADAAFDDFVNWSRNRPDDARDLLSERGPGSMPFSPYAGVEDIPAVPPAGSDAPAPGADAPAEGSRVPAPAASPAAPPPMPDRPPPFDRYLYPPDYAFDFSKCDNEIRDENGETQLDRMQRYLRERVRARADQSYHADFTRSEWSREQDSDEVKDAPRRLAASNERLKREWWQCVNGIATAPPTLTPLQPSAATPAPATPAPATTAGDAKGEFVGPGLGTRYENKWSLNLHVEYADTGNDDAPSGPVAGVAGSLNPIEFGRLFGKAFSPGVIRDPDSAADAGSARAFSDDQGVLRFSGAITGKYLNSIRPGARYVDDGDEESDFDFSLGAGYNFGDVDRKVGKDWKLYVDYDWDLERGGPSIGVKYEYAQPDSAYVETVPGYAPPDVGDDVKAANDAVVAPAMSDYLRIGEKSFFGFTYPQYGEFDPNILNNYGTYWANNACGDSALPPEGSGYLTAAESPVRDVGDQWAFRHVGLAGDEPRLDEFAEPVVVAVIDTGLDWHHLDFSWDNLWRNEDEVPDNGVDDDDNGYVDDVFGWSFTDNHNRPWDYDGHGTFVAGVIAATQGNDAGIDGINGKSRIMVLKALNNFGRTRATLVAKAIVYAADNGARLINLSVTGPGFPKIVQDAVDYALQKGVLVVNAAGNRADDIDVAHPDALRGVLTVAAIGNDDNRAVFSNVGTAVDIAAPGVDVVSLRARGTDFMYNSADTTYVKEDAFLGEDRRYYRGTGTSFATPIVTGVASLLLSRNPRLEPADIVRILEQSARDVGPPGRDRFTGYGVVDTGAALAADPSFFIYAEIGAVAPVVVGGQVLFDVMGVAEADQFGQARIEIGQGEAPGNWSGAGNALAQGIDGGSLGRIPLERFAGGGTWTIRLIVEHAGGQTREARYVIDL